MWLIKLIFSRIGPFLGLALVKLLPRRWAYKVGDIIVGLLLKRQESELYRAVRSNQAAVRGWSVEDERLHAVVREVLTNSAHALVEWFSTIATRAGFENIPCTIDESLIEAARRSQAAGKGLMVVGAHLSGFNILLMKIAREGWPVQILSYAEEEGSYQSDNLLRKRYGLDVTPISPASLRQAYQRLKAGGIVLTGVDRPDTGGETLSFFNRPTRLPIGHARLALRTGAQIMVLAIQKAGSAKYVVIGSEIIEPDPVKDEIEDAKRLAQQIVDQMELFIRERPSEWLMFVPVWPETMSEVEQGNYLTRSV